MNFSAWLRKAFSAVPSFLFLVRNVWHGRRLVPFDMEVFAEFSVAPMSRSDLSDVASLYAVLNGKALDVQSRMLLRMCGDKYCLTARRRADRLLIGIGLYYFNARDRSEETIHVAYTGLHASARGRGLGDFLRRHALRHFARCGLASASSRISIGNLPSLKGNLKLGFLPVETYFDAAMAEQRQYLICDLDPYR